MRHGSRRVRRVAPSSGISEITSETRFTAAVLLKIHRAWLGGIYDWAGEYRTLNLSKGGFAWPAAVTIPANMENFERGLLTQNTPCRPGTLRAVAGGIARVHADLLLIHPFRKGNGRLARWLAELMAYQAGLARPVYRFTGPGSKQRFRDYIGAVVAGYSNDLDPLGEFFESALSAGLARAGRG